MMIIVQVQPKVVLSVQDQLQNLLKYKWHTDRYDCCTANFA